ncbi:MAG TPA: ABC transporter substrate-binding protein, partial [Microthrixaceae bacterium]|nr:ABC transporter substrate-binding protein [Microthrixaceae bacterium]
MRSTWKLTAGVLLSLALTASACGNSSDDTASDKTTAPKGESSGAFINPETDCTDYKPTQGISGDTITLGTIRPETGNYAIYNTLTTGMEAYFKAANLRGGLEAGDGKKYKVELIKKNDEYDPAKTPALAKQLVEQDKVFALIGDIGTEPNLAIRSYMNDNCVPNIALATGSTFWGDANSYPWYIAGLPSYATEAHAWVEYFKANVPDAKIALLYQPDDFGKAYKSTIENEIKGTNIKIVKSETFDPLAGTSPEAPVTALSQSDADVLIVGIGGSPCPQSLNSVPDTWNPMTFISVTCASKLALSLAGDNAEGVYFAQPTLDPADPTDQKNPKVIEFKEQAALGGLDEATIEGGVAAPGWGFAAFFAEGLKRTKVVDRA